MAGNNFMAGMPQTGGNSIFQNGIQGNLNMIQGNLNGFQGNLNNIGGLGNSIQGNMNTQSLIQPRLGQGNVLNQFINNSPIG
jgi:hypothetical protein